MLIILSNIIAIFRSSKKVSGFFSFLFLCHDDDDDNQLTSFKLRKKKKIGKILETVFALHLI